MQTMTRARAIEMFETGHIIGARCKDDCDGALDHRAAWAWIHGESDDAIEMGKGVIVTVEQIKALRTEAGAAGDDKMVGICNAALENGEESSEWRECAAVVAEVAQA